MVAGGGWWRLVVAGNTGNHQDRSYITLSDDLSNRIIMVILNPRLSWFDSNPNLSAEHYIMDNEIQRWKT